MNEIAKGAKVFKINQKIGFYLMESYDAELDLRIARKVKSEEGVQAATERMKRIEMALDLLREELEQLDTSPRLEHPEPSL